MELGPSPWLRRRTQNRTSRTGLKVIAVIVALLVMFTIMAGAYSSTLNTIELIIDDQVYVIQTNQTSVEGVLRAAGLALHPKDRIQPAPDSQLAANDTIRITRAREVSIHVNGQTLSVRTQAITLADLFAEFEIDTKRGDALMLDGAAAALTSQLAGTSGMPHTVSIQRAVAFTVQFDDGTTRALLSTQSTIAQALNEAGIDIFLADRITPDAHTRITNGASVYIERSIAVTVQVDGQTLRTRTHQDRVGDLLAETGIMLNGQDYSVPALDTVIESKLDVRVVRVSEEFFIQQEPVPFVTQILPNPDMEIDTQQLAQEGQSGVLQTRIRIHYEDGQEISRQIEGQTLARAAQPKIINFGTNIIVRTIQTEDGPRQYWRHFRALATSYSASTAGTPATSPYYGLTALGWTMRHGIVAVDPDIIPLRSYLYVPGYGLGVAGDTGGAVIGKHVDLGFDDDNLEIWYRWVDVYVLTPIPSADQIEYILPNWPIERRR